MHEIRVVALAGGVGGTKLADGLAHVLKPGKLTIIVNIGDDFEHCGLKICPDIDTVCYTLTGRANPSTGWGRADETWNAFESLEELGGPVWFKLGDRDLGTHLTRTRLLSKGLPLSQVISNFCSAWGLQHNILPASDDAVPTMVETDEGLLPFQDYFVKRQCQPTVRGFIYKDSENARPAPGVLDAIYNADVVVICPSNPWVSIAPILAINDIRTSLMTINGIIVGVSPIIGGKAVKGPAGKMYAELGYKPTALTVAQHYESRKRGGLLNGFIIDQVDHHLKTMIENIGVNTLVSNTLMNTINDRQQLADQLLEFGQQLLDKY
jgi:LPPG:FO 2-phospho-L-lactate transferase